MIERNKVDLKEEMSELGLDEQLQSSLVLDRWKEEIEKYGKHAFFRLVHVHALSKTIPKIIFIALFRLPVCRGPSFKASKRS